MGLHVPGAAFVHPHDGLREALTREAVRQVLVNRRGERFMPIGRLVDERCIVNAMVALLATGGSTNHLIHWVAVAHAAGIHIDWTDFADLAAAVPLLARVYPNGSADVNEFQAAGGPGFVLRELLDSGCLHADVAAVDPRGLLAHTRLPGLRDGRLHWQSLPRDSGDAGVLRPAAMPFSETGGLRLLQGNLGRSVIKTSAVPDHCHVIEAPARVFDSQQALLAACHAGELERDVVAVVRFQGPRANGMPELHKLTPPLAVLQGKGYRVALVTDGRMSGASGKVPAAIHVSPEALAGGPLAKLRDGDLIRLDAVAGTLNVLLDAAEWADREAASITPDPVSYTHLRPGSDSRPRRAAGQQTSRPVDRRVHQGVGFFLVPCQRSRAAEDTRSQVVLATHLDLRGDQHTPRAAGKAQQWTAVVIEPAPLHESRQVGAQASQFQPGDRGHQVLGMRTPGWTRMHGMASRMLRPGRAAGPEPSVARFRGRARHARAVRRPSPPGTPACCHSVRGHGAGCAALRCRAGAAGRLRCAG